MKLLRKIVGGLLIASPFIALLILAYYEGAFIKVAAGLSILIIAVGIVTLGIYLLIED